ncbi:LysR family transcriptional regulator, partial [Acinetobacter baumannii]
MEERNGQGRRMDRWQAMRIFVKVAETASFGETARQLHMSAPA